MMRRLKIRQKLLWINLLSILAVVLFAGGFWIVDNVKQYEAQYQDRIDKQLSLISNNILAAVLFEDWDEARVILSSLSSDTAVIEARIHRNDIETVRETYHAVQDTVGLGPYALFEIGAVTTTHTEALLSAGTEVGRLSIIASNREVYESINSSINSVLLMCVIAMFIGTLMVFWLQRFVSNPIQDLSRVAQKVTQSNEYSLRGNFYYPDEIGSLTDDFNAMLEMIEKRDSLLESKVKERTQQLENKNLALELEIERRTQSEVAQKESVQKFEQAFMNAPIGMALVSATGLVNKHNRSLERILSQSITTELSLEQIISHQQIGEVRECLTQLRRGESNWFEKEVECHSDSRDHIYAIASFSAVRDSEGEFKYAVLQLQDITNAKQLSMELEHQASHDALTGLANRRVLKHALSAITSSDEDALHALCILDLDQFKVVNDTCGHAAGDELLRQLSVVLTEEMRDKDLIVRLGGDEFGLILYNCDANKARDITESIREVVEHFEFNWEGQTFRVGVSIGVVVLGPPYIDISSMMRHADAACFVAKDLGRNRVYITSGDRDEVIAYRQGEMLWVQKIHNAIRDHRFTLFHQPVVTLNADDDSHRFEVLIRMDDPKEGLIPPKAFIPAAERYGLSTKVDRWVINELISLLTTHPELHNNSQSYWVNLSGHSIQDNKFVSDLQRTIEQSGLPPGLINFEITETAVMKNIGLASRAMSQLKDLGCRFALDDFGSGISSFSYLKKLPVDILKIDGMFVKDILIDKIDLIFVKSIIDIAKVMGIKSVAEFVETEEIRDKLIEIGAEYGQGFALGLPEPFETKTLH